MLILQNCWLATRTTSCPSFMHSVPNTTIEVQSEDTEVVIAQHEDRISNFNKTLRSLKESGVDITRHGCLYETEPAYVTDQPHFLNSAVRGVTKLGPHELLRVLKRIEKEMGRTGGIRYGPRLIDLIFCSMGSIP
ncbi:Folate synthesis bifunctional protein, mitochondrial-like protein [Drosera capensis]